MKQLKTIIIDALQYLHYREEARKNALTKARKARMGSKQAILLLHSGELDLCKEKTSEASQLLIELGKSKLDYPEMEYYEALKAARQEYAEAEILYNLMKKEDYPTPESLDVPVIDYIMGLADVPGELRRQVLDYLREGKISEAEKNLNKMEEIYLCLVQAEDANLLLKGLRRKMDITRMVNERTRAEITTEVSRQRLTQELKKLSEKLN